MLATPLQAALYKRLSVNAHCKWVPGPIASPRRLLGDALGNRLDVRAHVRGLGRLMSSGGGSAKRRADREREQAEIEKSQSRHGNREEQRRLRMEAAELREAEEESEATMVAAAPAAALPEQVAAVSAAAEAAVRASAASIPAAPAVAAAVAAPQQAPPSSSAAAPAAAPDNSSPVTASSPAGAGMPAVPSQPVVIEVGAVQLMDSPADGAAATDSATPATSAAALPAEAEAAEVVPVQSNAALQVPERNAMDEELLNEADSRQSVQAATRRGWSYLTTDRIGKGVSVGVLMLAAVTLAIAVNRVIQKRNTPRAKRSRQVGSNKYLIDELNKYYPNNRSGLNTLQVALLKWRTGFSTIEIFRKFLWYVLRDRQFDQAAIDDLVALKTTLGLRPEDVAEALRERSQRVYDAYGSLMLNTAGMTSAGIERKATCEALFRKILYLTELDTLLPPGSEAAASTDVRKVFGATDDDVSRLRIVSLLDVDLGKLDADASSGSAGADEDEEGALDGSTRQDGLLPGSTSIPMVQEDDRLPPPPRMKRPLN